MTMLKKALVSLFAVITFAAVITQPINTASAASKPTGSAIVKEGKKYLGVRYKYGGTTPKGFDCSGFTSYTFKKKNVKLPRTAAEQYKKGKSVSKKNLKSGDLVFFKTTSKKKISHVGIYIGNNKFIHSAGKGVSITSINDPYYWKSKYAGAKRVL
ncbi:C40 family peptidase [Siminovitchia fortis]|uniref:NlpC/P60 family protein n=1 Tax=Siminovitchia fortis TaxID=254758 RepID=A0A443J0Q5_9BACI|nr:C40 family peptidase [Siminovitchia fortis]RWR13952.1 NlpC/P60 family protein [Siminovitchia fortis]WHY81199.1 C40 family peptidase [Siminovitchia fortis]